MNFSLIMVINCPKLYNPEAYGSFCIPPTTFSFYVTIQPLISDLKNNRHLTLIKVINCTKLYDPGYYGSDLISPKRFCYLVSIRP